MAKKKSKLASRKPATTRATTRKRKRRSDEELIRDLQDKIRLVKARQTARQLKETPSLRACLSVMRAIDKALDVAAEESETLVRHVLADARRPLAEFLEKRGLDVPKANLPRGRRPKDDADEASEGGDGA
jgi:hypothetical protein